MQPNTVPTPPPPAPLSVGVKKGVREFLPRRSSPGRFRDAELHGRDQAAQETRQDRGYLGPAAVHVGGHGRPAVRDVSLHPLPPLEELCLHCCTAV